MQEFAFSEKASVAACTASGPWSPETLWAVDPSGGAARKLDTPAASDFATVRKGEVVAAAFATKDQTMLDGRVYLPPGFDPAGAGKYPRDRLLLRRHLAGLARFRRALPEGAVGRAGYVVYVLQPSRGDRLRAGALGAARQRLGPVPRPTRSSTGRAKFLAAHPFVDAKQGGLHRRELRRLHDACCWTTKTDLFAAAISHAGIIELRRYWGEGSWGYTYSSWRGGVASRGTGPISTSSKARSSTPTRSRRRFC